MGCGLGGQRGLHPQLLMLQLGKIAVQHTHNEHHGGQEYGQRHGKDGTEDPFGHAFSSRR